MITGAQALQAQASDKAFGRSVDQAVREENRRAIAGEPTLAESDPMLEDFFNLTLEEIGITPEMLAEAKAKMI